jgi:hypothetical protein
MQAVHMNGSHLQQQTTEWQTPILCDMFTCKTITHTLPVCFCCSAVLQLPLLLLLLPAHERIQVGGTKGKGQYTGHYQGEGSATEMKHTGDAANEQE